VVVSEGGQETAQFQTQIRERKAKVCSLGEVGAGATVRTILIGGIQNEKEEIILTK